MVTDWFIQDFEKEILQCTARPEKVFIHTTKDAPLRLLDHNQTGDNWFLIEEAVMVDDRIIDHLAHHPSPTVISLIGPHDFLAAITANAIPLQIEEGGGYFGSVAKLSSGTLAANLRKLNSLGRPAGGSKIHFPGQRLCGLNADRYPPLYAKAAGVRSIWSGSRLSGGKTAIRDLIFCLKQRRKATVDWPSRYIHRHIENLVVKYICKTPLTPNLLTIATALLGFFLMYLFINGHMLPALFGTYVMAILGGASDKLTQIKRHVSTITNNAPLLDRLVEYGVYFSIAGFLSISHGAAPYIMAASLVLFQVADHIQNRFFSPQ